jgi:hypothetical protein
LDAHLFRRVCEALIPRLDGARLETIQAPAPDVVCLSFHTQRRKLHLLLQYGRRDAFLGCAKDRPAAPATPSGRSMFLRGHLQGRRVRSCVAHWLQCRLDILFSAAPADGARPCLLCLDLRSGPRLETGEDACADEPVRWPAPEELPRALEEWRAWPVLTPALRRTLPLLEELERQALLADLASGGGDLFVYGRDAELEIVAWPLPDALREGREERVFADVCEAASLAETALISGVPAAADRGTHERQTRKPSGLPANVQAFESSDGIEILRGRDAKGNWTLLRLANPYDLWMHVEGGPGAHVIIRRAQGQELPQRSLLEAAHLALVKSWRRDSARAGVLCAQAQHVRLVKGGKPGSVRVDKVECALELQPDPDIELRVTRL